MAGLVPTIHDLSRMHLTKTWMAGPSPAMTGKGRPYGVPKGVAHANEPLPRTARCRPTDAGDASAVHLADADRVGRADWALRLHRVHRRICAVRPARTRQPRPRARAREP